MNELTPDEMRAAHEIGMLVGEQLRPEWERRLREAVTAEREACARRVRDGCPKTVITGRPCAGCLAAAERCRA